MVTRQFPEKFPVSFCKVYNVPAYGLHMYIMDMVTVWVSQMGQFLYFLLVYNDQ